MNLDINLATDFMPISEFKKNMNEVAARIKETKRPVYITINGRPDLVLSDVKTYQASEEERQIAIAHIRAGLADIEAGRVYKGSIDDLHNEINKKLGLI